MDQVIYENQNLVYSIIKYFNGYTSKEDLFQVGCIGLLKAYQKFDSSKGVKFSTYAFPYIMGEMKKYVREDKSIKISRDISSLNGKIEKIKNCLFQQLMREPSIDEIAAYLDVTTDEIEEALNSVNCVDSFDYALNDEGKELTLYDMIGNSLDIDTIIELNEQLSLLSPQERQLIISRYMEDLTQQETANLMGMNQVQVSRKEQKILTHLRNKLTI